MRKNILKEYSSVFYVLLYFFDWITLVFSAIVSHRIYLKSWTLSSSYDLIIGISLLFSALIFPRFDLYRPWRASLIVDEMKMILLAWFSVLFLLFGFLFVTKLGATYSRGWMGTWLVVGFFFLLTERLLLRSLLRLLRSRGFNQRNIIIVGLSGLFGDLIRKIQRMPWTGFNIVGVFSSDAEKIFGGSWDIPFLGNWNEVGSYLQKGNSVDQVWIVMPLKEEEKLKSLLHALRHYTVDIRFFPDFFEVRLLNHSLSEIAGFPVINLSVSPMDGINRYVKAFEDRLLSAIFLTAALPLMLVVAISIKLSSPGPIFYRQERVGWNGIRFEILKFRTMPENLEKEGVQWGKNGKEPTRIGRFLRKTSIDEIPQFINVLKGEMSIVGPRPERPIFVEKFKDEIPGYMQKHLVKAGMTGWAQIHGLRGDTDLAKRIEYDLFYIENWSLFLDLKIILLTFFKGLWNKNAC